MAATIWLFNVQTTQSTGFTGPGLAAGVDDTGAQVLISAGYTALSWEGDDRWPASS